MNKLKENMNYNCYLYQQSILNQFEQICEPILQLGIKSFMYYKIFEDGRYLSLINNPEYSKKYFLNINNAGIFFTEEIGKIRKNRFYSCLSSDVNKFDKKKDPIVHLLYDFNMWNSFFIYKKSNKGFLEVYNFHMTREDTEFSTFFLNNLDFLELFCDYFNERAKDIIDCSDKKKLAHYDQTFDFSIGPIDDFHAKQAKQFLRKTYVENLNSQERNLFSLNKAMESLEYLTLGKNVNGNLTVSPQTPYLKALSPRQNECLFYLIRGQTAKQIAKELGCSYRTIETHIDHIKSKFKCTSKGQLIELAFENGLVDINLKNLKN